jgi:peptide/nickel transport system permease protein
MRPARLEPWVGHQLERYASRKTDTMLQADWIPPLVRVLVARTLTSLAVTAAVALLTFALLGAAPGTYLDELSASPQSSFEMLARMREQYGLDKPFYVKFWQWEQSVVRGDFGYSFVYHRPVRDLVAERVWNTLLLNTVALAAAWVLGVALGLTAAARRGSSVDRTIGAATTVLMGTPTVILAILLIAGGAQIGLPIGGRSAPAAETLSSAGRLMDLARHLLLPAAAVAAVWTPVVAQHTRTAVLTALRQPYMLAARARGAGRARLLFVHAFRESLNPLSSLFGLSVSALVSISLVVEVIMSWPGVGQLMYDAVLKRDIFLVVDLVQLSALFLLAGNIVGDLVLHAVDPRAAA